MTSSSLRITAFGVVLDVAWAAECGDAMREAVTISLPPGARPSTDDAVHLVELGREHDGRWSVTSKGSKRVYMRLDRLMHDLERDLAAAVALHAPRHVFFHAGVVATGAGALLLPGRSHAGKSTLTAALLGAGCGYVSDEYAVIGPDLLVYAYPRRLSLRDESGEQSLRSTPAAWGSHVSDTPLVPVMVAGLRYRPTDGLRLRSADPGEVTMLLINNAIAARLRPAEVLSTAGAVARRSIGLVGTRGEADEAAERLLALLYSSSTKSSANATR